MDREAWQSTVSGVAKNQTQLSDFTMDLMPLEKVSFKNLYFLTAAAITNEALNSPLC